MRTFLCLACTRSDYFYWHWLEAAKLRTAGASKNIIQHKQSNKIGNSLRDLRSTLFFALSKISIEFSQIGIQFSCVTYRDSKKQAFLVIYSFAWYKVLLLHQTQMHLNGISIVFFAFPVAFCSSVQCSSV